MPDNLFAYESVGVQSKNVLTRKANLLYIVCQSRGRRISMKAIYKITNKITNKCYIGQSNNPQHHWIAHKANARNNKYIGKSAIYDAIRKYGEDNFIFEIIGWFDDYNEKEKYYIKYYNSLIPNGYNIQEGGNEPPHKYGGKHHNSKYSQKFIDNIIDDLLSHKYTQHEIQKKYNVNSTLISDINRGVTHRRDNLEYPIIKTSKYNCSKEQIEQIIYLLKNSKCTCAEIAKYFGFSSSTIKAINSGRNNKQENVKYPIRNFRGKAGLQSVEAILAKRSTETIDTSLEK